MQAINRQNTVITPSVRAYETATLEIITVEQITNFKEKPLYNFIKRCLDIICSFVGLVVCLIPMLVISVIIKCDSDGGIIYRQQRLGKGEKPYTIYKFRTMIKDAERDGEQWAEINDKRLTRVGRVLRNSRLDELPQFINILRGDMSFVGPRPERACFYDAFERYIKGFRQRTLVLPGMTGLAQVKGGYELAPEEKIVYDIEYIKKRSILFDLKCILKTFSVVFTHKGAR